jgi:hypothetical protein
VSLKLFDHWLLLAARQRQTEAQAEAAARKNAAVPVIVERRVVADILAKWVLPSMLFCCF